MIPNRERWHYLAVKKSSLLLKRITSKHHGDFYCLICLHYFAKENKRESHKKVWKNKDFRNVATPSKDTKILEVNQYQKWNNAPFVIYADLECLIENIDGFKNNTENSSLAKVGKHIPLGFSVPRTSSFKLIENKHDKHEVCRSKKKVKRGS